MIVDTYVHVDHRAITQVNIWTFLCFNITLKVLQIYSIMIVNITFVIAKDSKESKMSLKQFPETPFLTPRALPSFEGPHES